jgi:hypothetical protein
MIDQNFEIIEIPFAIVAPRSGKLLLDIRVASLLFAHYICRLIDCVENDAAIGVNLPALESLRKKNS